MNKILPGFTVLSLLVILLGINRGFDFSDEGLYMLLADPDQENIAGIFNYDLFFKLIYRITGIEFGIVGMRLLRLMSYVVGAFSLGIFWKNLTQSKALSIESYLISLLGLMTGYAFLPSGLSYNSLSVFWASVILAIFPVGKVLSADRRFLHFLIFGTALAALFYIKITVCFSLGLLVLVYLVMKKEFNWKTIVGLLLPFLFLELLFYISLGDCGLLRIMQGFDQIQSRDNYQFQYLFKYTAVGFFWVGIASLPFVAIVLVDKRNLILRRILTFLGILTAIWVSYITKITVEWNNIILLGTAVLLVWQIGLLKRHSLNSNQKFLLGILLAMPFLLHFGSNVYWLRLGIHYWVFWVIALVFITSKNRGMLSVYSKTALAITVFILVLNGIWINPFEQEPLWNANKTWEYKAERKVMLTDKQIKLLEELKEYTCDESSVLAFYRIPGLAYLLGINIPKSPGYWDRTQVEFYYPDGINESLLLYYPYDSLPSAMDSNFQRKMLTMPNGEELQVLWRD